jgi:hypothetical protein
MLVHCKDIYIFAALIKKDYVSNISKGGRAD